MILVVVLRAMRSKLIRKDWLLSLGEKCIYDRNVEVHSGQKITDEFIGMKTRRGIIVVLYRHT